MKPIAYIHTDFPTKFGLPRQSGLIEELKGTIIFEPEYRTPDAFRGLEEFTHIWILWGFSQAQKENWAATVTPPRLGGKTRIGVFATRSPFRPNSIGLSCVKLEQIYVDEKKGTVLKVSGIDMMDQTPIYDIKPYIPYTDCHPEASEGYTKLTKEYALKVVFPTELLEVLPPDKQIPAIKALEQDPRPARDKKPEKRFGMEFSGYDIRFTVAEDILTVHEVVAL